MAKTHLGTYGGPAGLAYGAFDPKTEGDPTKTFVAQLDRLGLYGGPRPVWYGDFTKTESVVSGGAGGWLRRRRRIARGR